MPFSKQEDPQRIIAQSSPLSSFNSSYLPSNDNKTPDNGHLQSTNMSSNNETKTPKENFSLLVRLKVRFTISFY